MRVSIALTTYNGARYLEAQLRSFAEQTRLPDELVVCDDGSKDETIAVLKRFQSRVPFEVRIFENPTNLGFTRNFEKAIRACTGDLIFMSDQDDVWFPNKIQVVEAVFVSAPRILLAVHDGQLVDEKLVSHGATKLGQIVAGYGSEDGLVAGALTAVRKELIPLALPVPDGVVGHDIWLHLVAKAMDARRVLPESLELIRRHGENTSSWVASSLQKINRIDVWLSQWRTTPAGSYQDRIRINEALQARLRGPISESQFLTTAEVERAIAGLILERDALLRRETIPSAGFFERKIIALELLTRGEYRYFNGYGSFIRDLTR